MREPYQPELLKYSQSGKGMEASSLPLSAAAAEILSSGVSVSAQLSLNGNSVSIFYFPTRKTLHLFQHDAEIPLQPIDSIAIAEPLDYLDVFYLSEIPYIATYAKVGNQLNIYRLNSDSLTFVQSHYVGPGFSLMKVLQYRDCSSVLLYNGNTGECVKYQITVPPYAGLCLTKTWSDFWERTWGHFAFFSFGGENFFLNINQQYEKTMLSHCSGDSRQGTFPVMTQKAGNTLLNSAIIQGFQGTEGQAYFVNYQYNGGLTLYSIYPDCKGWWTLNSTTVASGAAVLHPFRTSDADYLLIMG